MDLRLPAIQPARSYGSAEADAIDRAGAKFAQATDKVAGVLAEEDKAQIIVETQEAKIQATRGLNTLTHTIPSEPYVSPERAEELFGGKLPGDIDPTEPVPGQPDPKVRQRRKYIPMHEIAAPLFERNAAIVVADAARNVKNEHWRKNFEAAVAKDVESKRAEVLDWQKAQRLADAEIRSVSQFYQLVRDRNWPGAKAVLENAKWTMSVRTRESLRAEYPSLHTKATVEDRLRGAETPEELDTLMADIAGNKIGDGSEEYGKLDPEDQYRFTVTARTRKHEIVNEALAAAKRAREAAFQAEADKAEQAIQAAAVTGESPTRFYSIAQVDGGKLDFNDFMAIKNALEADPKRQTRWEVYNAIALLPPEQLRRLNPFRHRPDLADEEYKQVTAWVRAAQEGGRSPLSEQEAKWIGAYVQGFLNLDPEKKQHEYNVAKARIINAVLQHKLTKDSAPITYNTIAGLASNLFVGDKKQKNQTRAVLSEAIFRSTGQAARAETLAAEEKKMQEEAKLVGDAYTRYVSPEEPSDEFRATVRAYLMNEQNMVEVREQLRTKGMNPDDKRLQIERVVQNLAPPESAGYAQQTAEDALQNRKREEVRAEAERQKAEDEAQRAAERAERQKRIANQPYWLTSSEEQEEREIEQRVKDRHYQVLEQLRGQGLNDYERSGRARATSEQARAEIAEATHVEFEGYRRGYREFLKKKDAGDAMAKALFEKFFLDSFTQYVKWRRGEVK